MSQYYDLEMTGPELSERLDKVLDNEQALENVYTKSETDAAIEVEKDRAEAVEALKANVADVYTKQQTDEMIAAEAQLRQAGDENLQEQLDDILDGSSGLTLTAMPELIQVGVASDVMLSARTTVSAQSISIKRDDTILTSGAGNRLDGVDHITPNAEGEIIYKASFEIGEANGDVTKVVHSVLPIFYGAGATYSDAQHQAPLRLSPIGSYTISVTTTGQYLFFIVPWSMKIDLVLMNGYQVPLDAPVEDDVYMGYAYKMYKSANAYDAGTYELLIVE